MVTALPAAALALAFAALGLRSWDQGDVVAASLFIIVGACFAFASWVGRQ